MGISIPKVGRKLGVVLLVLFLAGCGTSTKHYIIQDPNSVSVTFDVDLEKDFVKSISSISGGQTAMLVLVGPFTNNAVILQAKEEKASGEKIAFNQRLNWGANEFESFLQKNTTYQLVVAIQGTRSGSKPIGSIEIKQTDGQHFSVILHGDETDIQ